MERTIEGRVRKRLSKTTRTGRARRRELSDEDRQRLSDQAGSRPRGPNGRFLPNQHKKECTICVESKWALHFPSARISETCAHELDICLECIQNSIRADFDSKQWNEVSCPECNARLDSSAIVKYADAETFSRYDALILQMALRELPNFTWCPLEGCSCGQINEPGEGCLEEPTLAVCHQCNDAYCIPHNMAYHYDLTCAEFDMILRGPAEARDSTEYERVQAKMDYTKLKEMQRRAEEDQRQAQLSEEFIKRKTIKCPEPACGWQIERTGGCHHMSCTRCGTQFCWDCGAIFLPGRRSVARGNGHKETCFHYQGPEELQEAMHILEATWEAEAARRAALLQAHQAALSQVELDF